MTKQDLMATRYGKAPNDGKRNRRMVFTAATLLIMTFLGWAIWVAASGANQVKFQSIGYEVIDANHTSVRFSVESPAGPAVCAVQVLNQGFSVVGYREIAIASAGKYETFVNTTELGVSGLVDKCWLK